MNGTFLDEQHDLLELVANRLTHLQIRYFVTGSQASTIYGEPRFTLDIDIVIELSDSEIPAFMDAFNSEDFYLSHSAVQDAVQRREMFNLLHPSTGGKVDFVVAKDSDFDRSRMQRTRQILIGANITAEFASPEDVILKKLDWYRRDKSDRHIRDIVGVLKVQGSKIDKHYLQQWVNELKVSSVWDIIVNAYSPAAFGTEEQ